MNIATYFNELAKIDLHQPFPREEVDAIEERFHDKISKEGREFLLERINDFHMTIAGSVTYVMRDKEPPADQMSHLKIPFFESYPEYEVMVSALNEYPKLENEIKVFEEARQLLIKILSY